MKLKPFIFILVACAALTASAQKSPVSVWLTNADKSALFDEQKQKLSFANRVGDGPVISVDEKTTFQSIDGFGFALTGGSAMHIMRITPSARTALLKELFATDGKNIGVSYLRVSIGASDLNEKVFSYDDMPAGETDPKLAHFDLGEDKLDVIPLLKEILAINPKIDILGSPWSAPAWMKTNGDTRGGSLKTEYYQVYSDYLVKYMKAFKAQGITINAITVQNEPLNPKNNPSMLMYAHEQADLIKHIGPSFQAAGIKSKIIVYDHNCDRPDYADSILNDPAAAKYVDGSGFHLYGGKIEAMTDVHNSHPDKSLYFTEQMVIDDKKKPDVMSVSSPVKRLFIGATRNWSRNVLEWNLAADMNNQPHTDRGGCPMCQGAVTVQKDDITRSNAYYAMAHASKFVRPGSVRVQSNTIDNLPNVAFVTPQGKKVLIVTNSGTSPQTFNIQYQGKTASAVLNAGSAATYVWD